MFLRVVFKTLDDICFCFLSTTPDYPQRRKIYPVPVFNLICFIAIREWPYLVLFKVISVAERNTVHLYNITVTPVCRPSTRVVTVKYHVLRIDWLFELRSHLPRVHEARVKEEPGSTCVGVVKREAHQQQHDFPPICEALLCSEKLQHFRERGGHRVREL